MAHFILELMMAQIELNFGNLIEAHDEQLW